MSISRRHDEKPNEASSNSMEHFDTILEDLQKLSMENRGAILNVPDAKVQSLFSGTAQFPIDSEENLKNFEECLRDENNFKGEL